MEGHTGCIPQVRHVQNRRIPRQRGDQGHQAGRQAGRPRSGNGFCLRLWAEKGSPGHPRCCSTVILRADSQQVSSAVSVEHQAARTVACPGCPLLPSLLRVLPMETWSDGATPSYSGRVTLPSVCSSSPKYVIIPESQSSHRGGRVLG